MYIGCSAMVKKPTKKAAAGKRTPKKAGAREAVSPRNIDKVEKETIDRANKALSTLEVAIASWDAAAKKPLHLKDKFMRYRKLHDALSEWEKKMLRSIGKREDYDTRVSRLQEFVTICYSYS